MKRGRVRVVALFTALVLLVSLSSAYALLAANVSPAAAATGSSVSFWSATTMPASVDTGDAQAVELGIKFASVVPGSVSGVRFYKSAKNTGIHTATLWTVSGTQLATTTFTNETATGWQQATFATPITVSPYVDYVVSYHTNVGHYAMNDNYFNVPLNHPPLHAPASTSTAGNGVFHYGTATAFPSDSYIASNYWVDPMFTAAGTTNTTAAITTPSTVASTTTQATTPTTVATTTTKATTTTTAPAPTTTTTAVSGTPTTYPAPGTVGAKGTLTDVYPAGGIMTINTPTTLSNVKIHGGIDIYANTVLHNVYVEENGSWWGNIVVRNNASLVATDCTVKPTNNSPNDGRKQDGILDVSASSILVQRCDISGAGKGGLVSSNTTFEDSWFHDFTPYLDPSTGAWTHKDAVMTMGGNNITIRRCLFVTNNPQPYNATTNPTGFDPSTQTGAILLQPWDPISNVTVTNSFLQGGYAALRMQAIDPSSGTVMGDTGLVITNNTFGPLPKSGMYYTYDAAAKITTWSGNVNSAGGAIAHP